MSSQYSFIQRVVCHIRLYPRARAQALRPIKFRQTPAERETRPSSSDCTNKKPFGAKQNIIKKFLIHGKPNFLLFLGRSSRP